MNAQTHNTYRNLSRTVRGALFALTGAVLIGPGIAHAESEGIQVHGDWVLTINDPDGTLVLELPFSNALTPTGVEILEGVFTGLYSLRGQDPTMFAIGANGQNVVASEACGLLLQDFDSETRLVADQGATYSRSFSLGADCVEGASWDLVGVFTIIYYDHENAGFGNLFTQKALDAPVSVAPDQFVTLKVTFSFE